MGDQKAPLSAQARWLLGISGIFALSVALSNTFVNIYLWKVDESYIAIGWYNFSVYCTMPIAFIIAGYLVQKMATIWAFRAGICFHAGFYLLALLGGTQVARLPAFLGIVMGFAAGLYWFSFNLMSLRYTAQGSRERFYGLNGVMGAIAGIVAPPVSGFLISMEDRLGGLSGYHVIFTLSLVLFVGATVLSFFVRMKRERGAFQLAMGFRSLRNRTWGTIIAGCAVYGLREGVFLFLIGLLMYIATGSEMKLGEFLLLQGGLSFISFYLVSRWVKPTNRVKSLSLAAVLMACAALIFLLPVTSRHILWYGSIIAAVIPLFLVPLQGLIFDGVSNLANKPQDHTVHVVVREIFENLGRVTGIGVFLVLVAFNASERRIAIMAVCLGFVQLVTAMLIIWGQRGRTDAGNRLNPELRIPRGKRTTAGSTR